MSRMTNEKTAGTEDQHELVGINSTVPLKVDHSEDLTETAGGTTSPTRQRSAADVRIPLKLHRPLQGRHAARHRAHRPGARLRRVLQRRDDARARPRAAGVPPRARVRLL